MSCTKDYATLYAFYGPLLTQKQQDIAYDYFYEDISLGEIAQNYNISRSAVFDSIKRIEKALDDYENKLHLLNKYEQRNAIYSQIIAYNNTGINVLVNALMDIDE